MMRHFSRPVNVLLALSIILASGCRPQQPFFLHEDGDLSHYVGVATEIDFPDTEIASLDEVNGALPPFTLANPPDPDNVWDLTLEEAVRNALINSKVIRNLGGVSFGPTGSQGVPSSLLSQPGVTPTVYGPAQQESNPTVGGGVEQALSAFDAQFNSSVSWEKNDERVNSFQFQGLDSIFPRTSRSDGATASMGISKTAATGGTFSIQHNVLYDLQKDVDRIFQSDWTTSLEAQFSQPLLRGAGVQTNRINGPGAFPGFYNGVAIARLRTDQSLADFEIAVRDLVNHVEEAYWQLYYAYRRLHAAKVGRDAMLQFWQERNATLETGMLSKVEESQARTQFFTFKGAVEKALSDLYNAERNLRFIMGLATTDGRMIRPADELTTAEPARIDFDWYNVRAEAMVRSVELRKQKWVIKQRELEVIGAKNHLLPSLNVTGRYRWSGMGDHLIDSDDSTDNAYGIMTGGDFQGWGLEVGLSHAIGFRKEMAGVRHAKLNLARERAIYKEQELELSHQLSHAFDDLETSYTLSQTHFNRWVTASTELKTINIKYDYDQPGVTFSQVLDAQRRVAEAEMDYYQSLVNYNLAITKIHYRKGSLLEYNGVCLAEGPWPAKAYFDAHRRARGRDASTLLNYGFTRPKVFSRGRYDQHAGGSGGVPLDGMMIPSTMEIPTETIPTPDPEPSGGSRTPSRAPEPNTSTGPVLNSPTLSQATTGPAVSRAQQGTGRLDVAKLDLTSLTAAPPAVRNSAVQRASYVESRARIEPQTADTGPSTDLWKNVTRSNVSHEPDANRPLAPVSRPAPGWTGVQH